MIKEEARKDVALEAKMARESEDLNDIMFS